MTGTSKLTPGFEKFWSVYPRRQAKLDAAKAWGQMDCEDITDEIVKAVKSYPFSDDPKYIKLPATFIRHGCWMDEFDTEAGGDNDW